MPATIRADVQSLTDMVYGALLGETSWQDFLDTLNTRMPDGKSTLFFHDAILGSGGLSLSSGLEDAAAKAYNTHFSTVNPWMAKAAVRPVGLGVIADQMLPHEELLKTEFYHDYLRSIGCRSSIGVTIMREKGRSFNLSTLTSSTDAGYNRANAQVLTELAPHLRRAFDYLRRERSNEAGGKPLLDAIGVGLIYLGEERKVRSMNTAAQMMLTEGCGISVTPTGRLNVNDANVNEQLRATGRSREPLQPVCSGRIGNIKYTLVRLQSDFMSEFLQEPTSALIIERSGGICAHLNDRLSGNEHLTAAELRIASSIASGLSLRDTAKLNDISYETARSHLKNIFSKLGVNSQVALVRRLIP